MACRGNVAGTSCSGWQVLLVDADVEAGLLELFLDVDFALLDEREKVAAEPGNLGEAHAVLGEVDCLAGEVRRGGIAFCRSGVAVGTEQTLLELHGADGGVDLQRCVEAHVVGAGHGGEELCGPGTAVAAISGKALVDDEDVADGNGDEETMVAEVDDVIVVLDAVETVAVGDLVLAEQDLVRAFERRRHDETAALVVERGQQDWRGGDFLDGGQRWAICLRADSGYDCDGFVGWLLRGFVRLSAGVRGLGLGSLCWLGLRGWLSVSCLEEVGGSGLFGGGAADGSDGCGSGVLDGLLLVAARMVLGLCLGFGCGFGCWFCGLLLGGWFCGLDLGLMGGNCFVDGVLGLGTCCLERGRGERQGCERQDGSDGGVCAHSDLEARRRQSNSYFREVLGCV